MPWEVAAGCEASRGDEHAENPVTQTTPTTASATSGDGRRQMRIAHSSGWPRMLSRCGKDAAAVRKRHATTGGVVRSVSRPEAFDLHYVADLQDILAD